MSSVCFFSFLEVKHEPEQAKHQSAFCGHIMIHFISRIDYPLNAPKTMMPTNAAL